MLKISWRNKINGLTTSSFILGVEDTYAYLMRKLLL